MLIYRTRREYLMIFEGRSLHHAINDYYVRGESHSRNHWGFSKVYKDNDHICGELELYMNSYYTWYDVFHST